MNTSSMNQHVAIASGDSIKTAARNCPREDEARDAHISRNQLQNL